ncbi:hypothetical protein NKJ26_26700 [Mesorhizobium sp. M0152]|uniref:hypothetical protein n=1 Tax=Mesorhizobium sp. M0152 TaxID=2956898 RepID=UPI00333CF45A
MHALRSGILAAYAASDMADGRDDLARARYGMIAAQGLADYTPALAAHYAAAARWETAFWQRRRPQLKNARHVKSAANKFITPVETFLWYTTDHNGNARRAIRLDRCPVLATGTTAIVEQNVPPSLLAHVRFCRTDRVCRTTKLTR